MLKFLMLRVVYTLTRVMEIVYNSYRYLGITDLAWQLVTTTPTNCGMKYVLQWRPVI